MAISPFRLFLVFHIICGTVALLIAPLAMVTVKGGRWHRRWGKIYFWAMAGVASTATVLCVLGAGLFLFLIAIFSFYLALTGYRVLGQKKPGNHRRPFDGLLAMTMILAGGALIILGSLDKNQAQRWVPIIFGALSLRLGMMDLIRFFKPPPSDKTWLLEHMTRFLGAYIATVTAFSVVNFRFLPYLCRWLWPTAVGVAGIVIWRRYYARKFNSEGHGNIQ